jgi:hypothetical protein
MCETNHIRLLLTCQNSAIYSTFINLECSRVLKIRRLIIASWQKKRLAEKHHQKKSSLNNKNWKFPSYSLSLPVNFYLDTSRRSLAGVLDVQKKNSEALWRQGREQLPTFFASETVKLYRVFCYRRYSVLNSFAPPLNYKLDIF